MVKMCKEIKSRGTYSLEGLFLPPEGDSCLAWQPRMRAPARHYNGTCNSCRRIAFRTVP
jgi:hypothetical protein